MMIGVSRGRAGGIAIQRKFIPDVVCDQDLLELPAAATVRQAAERMRACNVGSVSITDDGRLM